MSRPLSSKYSTELGFSFNLYLGNNLEPYRKAVMNQDFDCACIIDGKEGSGKSVLGQQVACFLDKDHHIDLDKQMCFMPEQFKKAVQTLEAGKAIVWDEARRGLNRRRSTKDINIEMTDMLAECRQNNLFMVIIMPTFYDMDMNVAVWRTRFLIHVWYAWGDDPERPLQRGFFRYYSEEGKKRLYTNKYLRQSYEYPYLKDDSFEASFPHYYCVDETSYRARKRAAESTFNTQEAFGKGAIAGVLYHLKSKGLLSGAWLEEAGGFFGVTGRTIHNWRKEEGARNNS